MARLRSAAELKEALNELSPEEAWGDRGDVEKMFLDGLTSLKYLITVQPDLLQDYGIPAFQTGYLQQLAKDATAGQVVFVVKSNYDEYELTLKTWNDRILMETLEKHLEMHKPPLRPKTVNNVPVTLRHDDKTLAVDLYNGQRLELEADVLPDPPSARAQMARIMAGIAFASVFFAALYYAFNVISIIVKGR